MADLIADLLQALLRVREHALCNASQLELRLIDHVGCLGVELVIGNQVHGKLLKRNWNIVPLSRCEFGQVAKDDFLALEAVDKRPVILPLGEDSKLLLRLVRLRDERFGKLRDDRPRDLRRELLRHEVIRTELVQRRLRLLLIHNLLLDTRREAGLLKDSVAGVTRPIIHYLPLHEILGPVLAVVTCGFFIIRRCLAIIVHFPLYCLSINALCDSVLGSAARPVSNYSCLKLI